MDLILRPWRHYADFAGRSRRGEFWLFKLTFWVPLVVLMAIGFAVGDLSGRVRGETLGTGTIVVLALGGLYWIAALVPGWALTVRRLHDQGSSGWLMLLTFIPYVGVIVMIVFGCIRGNDYENEYGPDPRAPDAMGREALGEMFS